MKSGGGRQILLDRGWAKLPPKRANLCLINNNQVVLATPAERGESRNYNSLTRKVPNSAVIRNQWLARHGSNFSGSTPAKKKVAGRVAALSDDKQKFNALPDYQNLGNPASSGSEVLS